MVGGGGGGGQRCAVLTKCGDVFHKHVPGTH